VVVGLGVAACNAQPAHQLTGPGSSSPAASTSAGAVVADPKPPETIVPGQPVVCRHWLHDPGSRETLPWHVEYVDTIESTPPASATGPARIVAFRDLDGTMKPADWKKYCSSVQGPAG